MYARLLDQIKVGLLCSVPPLGWSRTGDLKGGSPGSSLIPDYESNRVVFGLEYNFGKWRTLKTVRCTALLPNKLKYA